MPTLLTPLALLGLAALPALAAIYWLRNRYRKRVVSSLILWADLRQAREGGTRVHRLQTPLLFLLELFALLMLVIAAAGPTAPFTSSRVPLLVVLDDSLSMQGPAEGETGTDPRSAREAGLEAIRDELEQGRYTVRFILAGDEPRVLGDPMREVPRAMNLLDRWSCGAPSAAIDEAIGLASELSDETSRILVVTDHSPPEPPEPGRVQWWAVGRSTPNTAFIGAARTAQPGSDRHRCFLEIANLADAPVRRTLTVHTTNGDGDGPGELIKGWTLDMEARETLRRVFELPSDTPALTARLNKENDGRGETAADDADPAFDNAVTLLPPELRPVRVQLNLGDDTLGRYLRRAVESVPNASIVSQNPELLLTDRPGRPGDARTWLTRFRPTGDDTRAYTGPFILDRSHPLAEGLELEGVIWAAGRDEERMPGTPIVAAGNTVLMTAADRPDGGRTLHIRYHAETSTLHRSPSWPVLIWNLLQWRADHLPGIKRRNVRLGGQAELTVERGTDSIELTDPAGGSRQLSVGERRLSLPANLPGVWRVEAGDRTHRFAVNPIRRSESEMTDRAAGRWGDWTQAAAFRWQYQNLAWIFALIAAALLVTHMALVARLSGTAGGGTGATGGGRV